MIFTVFHILSRKISYTFAIVFFCFIFAWISAFYSVYFTYSTGNFTDAEEQIILVTIIRGIAVFFIFHSVHFGLLHRLGISGFSKPIRLMNRYLSRDTASPMDAIDKADITALYHGLLNLPKINCIVSSIYSLCVMLLTAFVFFAVYHKLYNLTILVTVGFFTCLIYGFFSYTITEYLISEAKGKIEKMIFQNERNFKFRYFLSFKSKVLFTILLILYNMILLSVIIRISKMPLLQVSVFILLSLAGIGLIIYFLMTSISISLSEINQATKELLAGSGGFYFPSFLDWELVLFSKNYNNAALKINEFRKNLARAVAERTEELNKAYRELDDAYRLLQKDLTLAKKVQSGIVPKDLKHIQGVAIQVCSLSMREIGGDFYDIFEYEPGRIRVFLVDSCGNEIQAALITMLIKSEYEKLKKSHRAITGLLEALNSVFLGTYENLAITFRCAIADMDLRGKKISYSSAGHTGQFLITRKNITALESDGNSIGMHKGSMYYASEHPLAPGDKIMLFTEGIFNLINDNGVLYSKDMLKELIVGKRNSTIRNFIGDIQTYLKQYSWNNSGTVIGNDITLLGIEIRN